MSQAVLTPEDLETEEGPEVHHFRCLCVVDQGPNEALCGINLDNAKYEAVPPQDEARGVLCEECSFYDSFGCPRCGA